MDFEEFNSALTIFQGICLAPRNESGFPAAPGRLIKTISVPSGDHLGDESLSKRPMGRVIEPLRLMGADISGNDSKPPLLIKGGKQLSSIEYTLPVASAQIKSCLLLAGLYSDGKTTIIENGISRDHTERMHKGFGYDVTSSSNTISLMGGGSLKSCDIEVPSDISSAAFFMVAGCISENSSIVLEAVNINPTRTGVIDILRLMGGNIELLNQKTDVINLGLQVLQAEL